MNVCCLVRGSGFDMITKVVWLLFSQCKCWCVSLPVDPLSQREWRERLSGSDSLQVWGRSVYQPHWVRRHTDRPGWHGSGQVVSVRERHHGNHSDDQILCVEVSPAHILFPELIFYNYNFFYSCVFSSFRLSPVFKRVFVPVTQTIHLWRLCRGKRIKQIRFTGVGGAGVTIQ